MWKKGMKSQSGVKQKYAELEENTQEEKMLEQTDKRGEPCQKRRTRHRIMTENGSRVHEIRIKREAQKRKEKVRKNRIRKNQSWIPALMCGILTAIVALKTSYVASAEGGIQIVNVEQGAIDREASYVEVLVPIVVGENGGFGETEKEVWSDIDDGESVNRIVYGEWEYLGEIDAAAYCNCEKCTNKSGNYITYSGEKPTAGVTAAADLSMFRLGDQIRIGESGDIYRIEDRISSDRKEKVSIYFNNHEEALKFGRKKLPVYRRRIVDEIGPGRKLGTFKVTGYCSCEICCGEHPEWEHLTKTGTVPRSKYTVAVDPEVIPLGTVLYIDGVTYTAEDTGRAVKGNRIDIYFDTHEEAENYGKRERTVFVLE